MVASDRKFLAFLVLLFLTGGVLINSWLMSRPFTLQLTFEMAADRPAIAQLFYNTGRGFTEIDSAKAHVRAGSLNEFQTLSFRLPSKNIQRFRLDPAEAAGTFVLRSFLLVDDSARREPLNLRRIVGFHEIAQIRKQGAETQIITAANAQDPSVVIELNAPVRVGWRHFRHELWPAVGLYTGLVVCLALAWRARRAWFRLLALQAAAIRAVHARMHALAAALSSPDFIRFDAFAMWVYLLVLFCFAGSVAADLNGSSAAMLNLMLKRGGNEAPLLGEPRAIRSDEWGFATPDALSQALRTNSFEVENSNLGGHSVSLLGNLPVWHVSSLFRPQFWGFFVLPVDYGFAFFWQSKALMLVIGTFTWLLLISGSSKWALTGALWFLFSPSTQWSYSWASGLPEMIGLSCLACLAFCYLTVATNRVALVVAGLLAASCSINLALCAYVPHLLPIAWIQVAVFGGWLYGSRKTILQPNYRLQRSIAFIFSLCVIGIFAAITYPQIRVVTQAISNTVYPGHRRLPGGTLPPLTLAVQLLPWAQNEDRFPAFLGNISEGAGFLWLAPVALFLVDWKKLTGPRKAMFTASIFFYFTLLAWMLLPIPIFLGSPFGLDRTYGTRCIPALGLVNIALVSVCLAHYRFTELRLNARGFVSIFVAGTAFLTLGFTAVNNHVEHFFSLPEIVGGAAFLGLILTLMSVSRHRLLPFVLVGSQALFFGAVNPVQRGTRVFTSSAIYRFVHSKPAYTRDKWIIYSNQPTLSGFFAGMGCQVYTGQQYVPDIDHFPLFAARALDLKVYNRLGYRLAMLPGPDEKMNLRLKTNIVAEWKVAPTDPILRQLGIRYIAFDDWSERPPVDAISKLIPLADHPIDGFWLYQLP